jgi:alanine racemase
MSRPATLTIIQKNLTKNLAQVRNLSKKSRIWACVKAGGYGHGMDSAIRGFSEADGLALLEIEEAYEARHLGWNKSLLLLEGVFHERELLEVENLKLEVVVHNEEQLDWCINFKGQLTGIWVKINSGMNRLGFNPETMSSSKLKKIVDGLNILRKKVLNKNGLRWLTHFSRADQPNGCQIPSVVFKENLSLLNYLPGELISLSNSSALVCSPVNNSDWVRPGILLYGAPSSNYPNIKMQKVLSSLSPTQLLTTEIVGIQHIKKNEYVGYGTNYKSNRSIRVGVAAIGYADGYPRSSVNGTSILVGNKKCKLIGVVSMDLITIDLTNCPNATIGTPVECWGESVSILEIAKVSNRLCYELFTGVTARVRRTIIATE